MSGYKRFKLGLDAVRNLAAKITKPKTLPPHQSPRITELKSGKYNNDSGFSQISPISQRLGFNRLYRQERSNLYLNFGAHQRRFYYVDRNQIYHFKPRGYRSWFQNPRNMLIVVVVSAGVSVTLYFGNLETVPYTKRKHVVLLSRPMERRLGEYAFEKVKAEHKGKILPAAHPVSIRVRLIAKDIIEALQRGLNDEHVWKDVRYAPQDVGVEEEGMGTGEVRVWGFGKSSDKEGNLEVSWGKQDEVLDDLWVQQSRKKGKDKGSKSTTQHLEGLNWEVLVINEPIVNAFCMPGGKIVVFTGLLQHFKSDAEIATIIGHEVGHAVARHSAEGVTKNLWFAILQLVLAQFVMPDLVTTMSSLFLRLPFSRRMEMEADYIGLLLIASAGYDPRVAPSVYAKLGQITGESGLRDYLSTHPSGKKRALLLAQAKVMEEALTIYREVAAGRGVEGFL